MSEVSCAAVSPVSPSFDSPSLNLCKDMEQAPLAAPAPMLDRSVPISVGDSNSGLDILLNSPTSADGVVDLLIKPKRKWARKQSNLRLLLEHLMLYWMSLRQNIQWFTLTSSPDSPRKLLRHNFELLRRRIEKHMGWERNSIKYRCIDTNEGFGVLHCILLLPMEPNTFWMPYDTIRGWWMELHQARQFKTLEVKHSQIDAGKLSTYLLSQYIGEQDLAVRSSGSRLPLDFVGIRKILHAAVFKGAGRRKIPEAVSLNNGSFPIELDNSSPRNLLKGSPFQVHYTAFKSALWKMHRVAVRDVIFNGHTTVYGDVYFLLNRSVVRL